MYRRICALLLALLCLFAGCQKQTVTEPLTLTDEVAVYEGEGYRLSYPAFFSMTRQAENTVYFTATGADMVFSLTREENPYGVLPIEEYLDEMSIYDGVKLIDDHSFAVEKHIPNMVSGYFLYTVDKEYIYLLEYNYDGTETARALAARFAVECL